MTTRHATGAALAAMLLAVLLMLYANVQYWLRHVLS
jgi:hypothetical protein